MLKLPTQLLDNRADCLERVLRLFDHCPRIRRVCHLKEIRRHDEPLLPGWIRPAVGHVLHPIRISQVPRCRHIAHLQLSPIASFPAR
jgi:hypothetical protein